MLESAPAPVLWFPVNTKACSLPVNVQRGPPLSEVLFPDWIKWEQDTRIISFLLTAEWREWETRFTDPTLYIGDGCQNIELLNTYYNKLTLSLRAIEVAL